MPDISSTTLEQAVQLHQSGQIEEAAAAYRRILESSPDDPNAIHLLGVAALQSGRLDEAVQLIGRAIEIQPNVGVYHLNLALALRAQRKIDDAIAEAEKAIALDPKNAAAGYHAASLAFADDAQIEDAVFCLEKAVESDAGFVRGHLDLAAMLDRLARTSEANAARDAALAAAQEQAAREPDSAAKQMLLGQALEAKVRYEDATLAFRKASQLAPKDPTVFHALGVSLQMRGQRDEAMMCFKIALRSNPNLAPAGVSHGELLDEQGFCAAALEEFRAAVHIMPDLPAAHAGMAHALAGLGEVDESIDAYREALRLAPTASQYHDSLLLMMHYWPKFSREEVFEEHLAWAREHAARVETPDFRPGLLTNERDPERPIRVGFVSADLRRHPVAKFLEPILEHHDRAQYFCVCYSDAAVTDDVTERLKKQADGWRNVRGASDAQVAQKIRDDGIDVLVDLSGHTGGNRLLAFARRAAPVQITQFAYPDTTGLKTIDLRVTDAHADPPGSGSEKFHTEQLARLPRVAWCYRPHDESPQVAPSPAGTELPITFGSVNTLAKLSADVIATWQRVLEAVPRSRMIVLTTNRDVDHATQLLQKRGLDPTRFRVVPRRPAREYLELFGNIDIALDPFPYNGGVTTCDTLWMGVPVIALAGDSYVSRQGVSLLSAVGLSDLIASSRDDYVAIAAKLADDRERLMQLRRTLRETMRASPLCDWAGYTAELQQLWRDAWRRYCEKPLSGDPS